MCQDELSFLNDIINLFYAIEDDITFLNVLSRKVENGKAIAIVKHSAYPDPYKIEVSVPLMKETKVAAAEKKDNPFENRIGSYL